MSPSITVRYSDKNYLKIKVISMHIFDFLFAALGKNTVRLFQMMTFLWILRPLFFLDEIH